ncbi:MAG: RNA-binding transcriptional accessory protein [Erysipelotrichaceae bacterium]|nr:RNA-binding transcriptional accessory protein [Erysipelotrichaceae bacterium]
MEEAIIQEISKNLKISIKQTEAVLQMLEEGNTIPFIARYRKEQTGGLEEVTINEIQKVYQYECDLKARKDAVIRLIDEKGLLTDELKNQILEAKKLVEIEDLYRPFKEKKKTKATEAINMGLQGLADYIMEQKENYNVKLEAEKYLNDKVTSVDEAVMNALYIIAEKISDNADVRKWIRNYIFSSGFIVSKVKKGAQSLDEKKTYEIYYDYKEQISTVKAHRLLAMNRGQDEKILTLSFTYDDNVILQHIENVYVHCKNPQIVALYKITIKDSFNRLIAPSVEREIYSALFDDACNIAISIFGKNAKQLLLQSPIKNKMVLGVDPGYRTGCKLAVVNSTGKFVDKFKMFPHNGKKEWDEAINLVVSVCKKYDIDIIAIGNGTASRETEKLIIEAISKLDKKIQYALVSEAGASVYSASEEARKEFPDFHVEERSAVSIARRIIDPLAELVKIDPKSIGVGQYQHDVNQKKLDEELTYVVTSAVNTVGVDLNTASNSLLKYVSGLNGFVANNIVKYRDQHGTFTSREELLNVSRLNEQVYQQAAGFLRVKDGINPLDATGIHPESYFIANRIMEDFKIDFDDLGTAVVGLKLRDFDMNKYIKELKTDTYTLEDVIKYLKTPGLDPRDEFDKPLLKSDVVRFEDLNPGDELEGTVRNIIDFGAFIDIGIADKEGHKIDGLVHISKITNKYIKHPIDVLHIGQIVKVWVLSVDQIKRRIQLTMINPEKE